MSWKSIHTCCEGQQTRLPKKKCHCVSIEENVRGREVRGDCPREHQGPAKRAADGKLFHEGRSPGTSSLCPVDLIGEDSAGRNQNESEEGQIDEVGSPLTAAPPAIKRLGS
jgi:hypothetical protein